MQADRDSGASPRIATIDAIRGFAVCGILLMNIVAMAMPTYAYVDPPHYGGASGADLIAWAASYALADGKMRALFTLLFGASMSLVAERAEGRRPGPAKTHYRRMAWLLVFGMIHAWGIWYGDILVDYAVAGAIAFLVWRWRTAALLYAALVLLGIAFALDLAQAQALGQLKAAATGPHPPAQALAAWQAILADAAPRSPEALRQLHLYRGTLADAFAARAPTTWLYQSRVLPALMPETLGYMLLGMALLRGGFLAGAWPRRRYGALAALGFGVALPLHIPIEKAMLAAHFDPAMLPLASAASFLLRPWLALAYAAGIILLVQSGRIRWLTGRLAAAGRMAFSNYVGSSIVATTLFYGYGFGLFGTLSRAELYGVVAGIWLLILGWSLPWLAHFHYGPLEWLWRSLARGGWQTFRR